MLLLLQPSTPDPRLRRAPLPGLRGMLLDAVALKLATRPAGLVVPTLVFALPLPAAALTHIAVVCLSRIDASICQTEVRWHDARWEQSCPDAGQPSGAPACQR
jgi:hypothetical protein